MCVSINTIHQDAP